jgi:murein DD-endopeptidase MepM/ murein hydrolase activator NlpD
MAVNPQKLLPPPSSALVKVGKIKTSKKSENNSTDSINTIDAIKKELEKIKENLEKIYSLVLDNNKLTEKDLEVKRLSAERLKFAEKEKRLETKDPEKKDERDDKSIPKLGIFDRINRFITFTLLGWVAVRLVKYLPKLLEFSKNLLPVMEFFSSFTANFFKGVVDFIDFGYNAYDKVKDFVKGIGGEPFEKAFDNFSSNLNKFVNLAIIAGIAASGRTDFGLGKKPGSVPKPGQGGRSRVTTSGGGGAGRPDLRNPLRQRPNITGSGGGRAGTPDIRNPLRQKPKITGSGGSTLGKFGGKVFGRIPIIGGLVSFIISVLSGEPVGRAAAKAVGFSIGSALGTFIPVPFVGTILGGMLGDIVGGALYDTLVSNKKEETPEVVAKRGGGRVKSNSTLETVNQDKKSKILYTGQSVLQKGTRERIIDHTGIDPIESRNTGGLLSFNKENNNSNITRGGKKVGGPVQRKVRRVVKRIVTPPKSTPIAAGKSVGGKEKLKELFPEPPQGQVGKSMDPYGYTTGTSEKLGQIPFLGPLFNIFGKTLLGDLPNKSDYQKVGMGLGAWINTAVSQGQLQGNIVSAFSDGGMIEGFGRSDISGWVEKSVEELVKNKVTEAINELKRNLGLKPLQENVTGVTGVTGPEDFDGELGSASDAVGGARLLMEAGFPMLAAAILSGNIQAESAWKGQRTPWILNDGAGINKGLISWNRTRITNAEKFLGKPLETASNAEQIKWIKEELRQYGLLDKFMDPNRTESQLKSDSYKYIGWGIEGDRWAQSSRIFAALQKGERGTFEPAKSSSGRPSRGSLSSVLPRGNPVPSSSFGWRWGRMHRGQDIGVDANSPVTAIEDGKVIDIYKNFGGWGDAVVVQHSDGSKNIYGHVIGNVSANSKVKRGQGIAKVKYWPNAYGNKDNTHLHFERVDSNGQHIDPKKYLGLQGGGIIGKNIKSIQTQASYDDGQPVLMVMAIQPILIKEQNPMRTGGNKIAFIGGVNSNNTNKSSLFVG